MDVQFGEFEPDRKVSKSNMEDILKKDEEFSIDWDNFDNQQQDPSSIQKSNLSGLFNQQNKLQNNDDLSRPCQISRSINEISCIYGERSGESFRFHGNDSREQPQTNQRYEKIQKLLTKAKKNGMEAFYKNLDQMNKQPQTESKFENYNDFKEYLKNLKETKRGHENSYENYKNYEKKNSQNSKELYKVEEDRSFKKKTEEFLPPQFVNYDDDEEENPFSTEKYEAKEIQMDFNKGEKRVQYDKEEDAEDFFDFEPKQKEKKKESNLEPIREEKHASFEKSFEEQKLNKLFSSYQKMRSNFDELMKELKDTNQGQEKIVEELKKMKDSWHQQDKNQVQVEKQEKKEKARQQKNYQLQSIKNEIQNIKTNDRDIVYVKMSEKIEHLEGMLMNALQEVNEEKEKKVQPKIINYFCEPKKEPRTYNEQIKEEKEFSKQESYEAEFSREQRDYEQKEYELSEKEDFMMKEEKKHPHKREYSKVSEKYFSSKIKTNQSHPSFEEKEILPRNDFTSPLQLNLSHVDEPYVEQQEETVFQPSDFGKQYIPKDLFHQSKNLRNCLTQKNSIVFESFQFTVAAKFSIVDNPLHPIEVDLRVGNKCSIDLSDVFLIVYGPQGPGLLTDPTNIYQERVKKNTNFSFKVCVNKEALDDNGFSIQISYRTESSSKKKLNFKVTLPTLQLIKPQFIYEEQFIDGWNSLQFENYIIPKKLDQNQLRSHEDLKIILPFIDINEPDEDKISYGLMFRYPCSEIIFMLKLECSVYGKGFLQLRTDKSTDKKLRQQILDVLNFIFFSPTQ